MNKPPDNSIEPPNSQEIPEYLIEVRDVLRKNMPKIWAWFQSDEHSEAAIQSVQLDLLKSTVRLDHESNPSVYGLATAAAESLNLDVPITIYQAKQSGHFNASISCDKSHAHVVLEGDLQEKLNHDELTAVFGHELGHLRLWRLDDGEFLAAGKMLVALNQDQSSQPVYAETLRLFSQYTEVFCDRGAFRATDNLDSVVSSLIKIITGVKSVKVADYLKQADEVFAGDTGSKGTNELTHPELYIRARALDLWRRGSPNADQQIQQMIQGKLSLERMDLSRQKQASRLTNEVLDAVLSPDWMQCEANLAHARLYFERYQPGRWNRKKLIDQLSKVGDDFRQFVGYLMLDFVTADRELMEPALAHTISLADDFGFREDFIEVARKELRLRKKQVREIEKSATELAEQAAKRKIVKQEAKHESSVDSSTGTPEKVDRETETDS